MKRTGTKSAFADNPELYYRIMKQASLKRTGKDIAKNLGISEATAQTAVYLTKCIGSEDWNKIISGIRNGAYSKDLLKLASEYAEKELPEEIWQEYEEFKAKKREEYAAKKKEAESKTETSEIDETAELKSQKGITIWEQKMLCNSNQMQELMVQLMDTVIPKYFGDSGTMYFRHQETLQELRRLRDSVDLLTAAVTRISEESMPKMEKEHIDANADMLNDTLRGIRENCGKMRGRA